jgi:hypothetical protein
VNNKWIDKLLASVNHYINLSTTDGIDRDGRISGFVMRSFVFNGQKIDVPTEIELNGDPNDKISLDRIASMDVT